MKKVKRLAAVAISVILLTLNASTMTYGFQNDDKISRDAISAIPEKQTILYYSWDYVKMYSPDGQTADIHRSEMNYYKTQGWSKNKYDIYTTMYSSRDLSTAKTVDVLNCNVDDYKKNGWIPKSDLITTLYSDDGRSIEVNNDQIAKYKAVGWKNKSDVYTTLYAEDGRKQDFLNRDVARQKTVGWYEWSELHPTLYSADGRTIQINKNEVEAYKKVGWYELNELYVPMYAEDGRTITVWKDSVEDYKKVGWYATRSAVYSIMYDTSRSYYFDKLEIPAAKTNEYIQKGCWDLVTEDYMTVLFSADDRRLAVKNTEVQTYKKLGWYTYKEYLDIKIDPLIKSRQFEPAMQTLEQAKKTYTWNEGKQAVINQKEQSLRYSWMKVINSPIAIISSNVTDKYNYPKANITFRNISDKTIVSFEIEFICYDSYGKVTTDYPWLYNGKFTGISDRDNIPTNELNTYTWTLYSNERTASIKNVRIVKVAYSDGTTWHS